MPKPVQITYAKKSDCSACDWRQEDDGQWGTDCSETFAFREGGPKENGYEWCPYCGKKLEATPYINDERTCADD